MQQWQQLQPSKVSHFRQRIRIYLYMLQMNLILFRCKHNLYTIFFPASITERLSNEHEEIFARVSRIHLPH